MDDTRHVASWIGGQEALHDRVLTLDEALAAVEAVDAPAIQRLAGQLFRDDVLRLAAVAPARYLRGLEATPPVAGMTATADRAPDADARPRASNWSSPHAHLRLGSLALARTELETLAGLGRLDTRAWSTWPRSAGGPATWPAPARRPRWRSRGGEEHPVALLIAAEAAAALGRPERGAPACRAGDGQCDRARSMRSSPGCRARRSGRPMPTSRRRPHRRSSTGRRTRPSRPS